MYYRIAKKCTFAGPRCSQGSVLRKKSLVRSAGISEHSAFGFAEGVGDSMDMRLENAHSRGAATDCHRWRRRHLQRSF